MTNHLPKRKRIFLVNRDFQLRYTRIAVVIGIFSTLLTMFLVLFPLYQFKIIRTAGFVPTPFLLGIGLAALCNFFVVAFMGVLVTHRIAGPMYALVRQMRQVQAGDFNAALAVRRDDDLKYLVRNYNDMIDALTQMTRSDRDRLDTMIRELEKDGASRDLSKISEVARNLRDTIDERIAQVGKPIDKANTKPSNSEKETG